MKTTSIFCILFTSLFLLLACENHVNWREVERNFKGYDANWKLEFVDLDFNMDEIESLEVSFPTCEQFNAVDNPCYANFNINDTDAFKVEYGIAYRGTGETVINFENEDVPEPYQQLIQFWTVLSIDKERMIIRREGYDVTFPIEVNGDQLLFTKVIR